MCLWVREGERRDGRHYKDRNADREISVYFPGFLAIFFTLVLSWPLVLLCPPCGGGEGRLSLFMKLLLRLLWTKSGVTWADEPPTVNNLFSCPTLRCPNRVSVLSAHNIVEASIWGIAILQMLFLFLSTHHLILSLSLSLFDLFGDQGRYLRQNCKMQ